MNLFDFTILKYCDWIMINSLIGVGVRNAGLTKLLSDVFVAA